MKEGKTRLTYLPVELDEIVQKVKRKQGFNSDSSFIRYCILHYLEAMSVLTTKAHEAIEESGQETRDDIVAGETVTEKLVLVNAEESR